MRQFGKMLKFYEGLHANLKVSPVFLAGCTEYRAKLHKEYFTAIGVGVTFTPSYNVDKFPDFIYDKHGNIEGIEEYKPELLGYRVELKNNKFEL